MDIITIGFLFGIDLLFWAWVIITIIAFLLILIPDPIPFIDEAIFTTLSIGLLITLIIRGGARRLQDAKDILGHPLVYTFIIVIAGLWIGHKFYKKRIGGKK